MEEEQKDPKDEFREFLDGIIAGITKEYSSYMDLHIDKVEKQEFTVRGADGWLHPYSVPITMTGVMIECISQHILHHKKFDNVMVEGTRVIICPVADMVACVQTELRIPNSEEEYQQQAITLSELFEHKFTLETFGKQKEPSITGTSRIVGEPMHYNVCEIEQFLSSENFGLAFMADYMSVVLGVLFDTSIHILLRTSVLKHFVKNLTETPAGKKFATIADAGLVKLPSLDEHSKDGASCETGAGEQELHH